MTPHTHRSDIRRAAHAKRKPLKRSTFVFPVHVHRVRVALPAHAPTNAGTATHTAPKRVRKLFTSLIGFCHRICANAQTFRPSRPFPSCRSATSRAPGATITTVADARARTPEGTLMTNAKVDPTVTHERPTDLRLPAPHRFFITYA
jgi:hypothetical protein